ncbi:MAG: glycosyltransferase [Cyanobacteria bacterium J06634_5]
MLQRPIFQQTEFQQTDRLSSVIAIYLDSLQGYGADKILLKIANGLVHRGLKVDLILSKASERTMLEVDPSIRIINLRGSRFTPIKNTLALSAYLKRRRPDVLFSSIHFNNIVATLALALSRIKCKLILRQANTLQEQLKDYSKVISQVLHPLTYLAYKRADLVVSQCSAMVSDLTEFMKVDEAKIKVIYNPTITADIAEKSRDAVNHKWLTGQRQYPVILSVGRLKPQKDFETLLKAFQKLKRHYSADAKLIILGEGPLREHLEELAVKLNIQNDVDLIGFRPNPYAFMSATDIYVSSSRYEGLPNTLIEALSLGKRVVATACQGGTAEILKYGKYGRLVPVSSPDVMAKSIAEALMSPNLVGPEATKDFDYETQVYKYFSMFLQVLETPKAMQRYATLSSEAAKVTVH